MATEIRQGVKYVIEAEDKASATAQKSAENVERAAEKVQKSTKKTAEEGKKAVGGINVGGEILKGLLSQLGGGFNKLVPIFAKVGAAGAAAFGVIGVAVQAIYTAIKAVGEGLSKLFNSDFEKDLDRINSKVKSIGEGIAQFEKEMDEADERAARAAESRQLQLDAIDKMKQAQIEYNRQQALSLAMTDKEREAVNEMYDDKLAAAQQEGKRAQFEERRRRLEESLESKRESERRYNKDSTRLSKEAAESLSKADKTLKDRNAVTGFAVHVGNKLPGINVKEDNTRAIEYSEASGKASSESLRYLRKAEYARRDIVSLQEKLEALGKEEDVSELEFKTRTLSASNARVAKARKEAEEIEKAKNAEAVRAEQIRLREQEKAAAQAAAKEAAQKERAEKERQDILARKAKEDAAEIARAQKEAEKDLHRQKMANLAIEKEASKAALADQADAEKRLAAARSAVAQAWGWYRNKDSMQAQLDEEKAQAAAEKQFEKDFDRLRSKQGWRTAKNLSVDQEATRRLALAKEEERSAQKAVIETAEHARAAAASLAAIEAEITQGGE